MNRIFLALLLTLDVSSVVAQSPPEILSVEDHPVFSSTGQSVWGPERGVELRTFKQDIFDIADEGTMGSVLNGRLDLRTADPEGPLVLGCEAGAFLDVLSGDCYSCPDGYIWNPLKRVDEEGVCSKTGSLSTAAAAGDPTFFCDPGEFPDLASGKCYSCPAGYSHNPLLPANVTGVCYLTNNTTANQENAIGCPGGQFPNAALSSCYSCPPGYNHNWALPVNWSGVCYQPAWYEYDTMSKVGYRYWDSCDWRLLGVCVGGWDYSGTTGSGTIRNGNNYYKCDSGFTHNILVPFNNNGICYKYHAAVNDTADYRGAYGTCSGGDFDGLNGYCYSCPSGSTHNPLLPVTTAGVCYTTAYDVATAHEDITLICDEGDFLDLVSGSCYTCPSGYGHNPAFPANISGVCFETLKDTADLIGDTALGCPSGSFLDVVTGSCYSCPDGHSWNPLIAVDKEGVCFKLEFHEELTEGDFQLGVEADYDYSLRLGVEGGIDISEGDLDIDYRPAVKVELEKPVPAEGPELITIKTSQLSDDSTIDMSSTFPSILMWLDTYLDAHSELKGRLVYPYFQPDPDEVNFGWSQRDERLELLDSSTDGEKRLGDEPIAELYVGTDGLSLSSLGDEIGSFTGGFDPPFEIKKDLIPTAGAGLSLGYVIVELGLTFPDINTPARISPPYVGNFGEEKILGSDANTGIKQWLAPGSRTGIGFGILGSGVKDTDVGRFDIDLDGFFAVATQKPLGVKVSHGTGIPLVDYWNISLSIFDLDNGFILGFRKDLDFAPNLSVTLNFSKPVSVEKEPTPGSDTPEYETVTSKRVTIGDEIRFIHPGGEVTIETVYDVNNNVMANDTDLILQPIFEGEILGFQLGGLAFSPLPAEYKKMSAARGAIDASAAPIKLVDLNFLDGGDVARFSVGGFSSVTGSSLFVESANRPPIAEAGVDQDANEGSTVQFAGSFTDPDTDDTHSYAWDFGDSETAIGTLSPTHVYGISGTYTASLTVTDNKGAFSTDTMTVTVTNLPPVADDQAVVTDEDTQVGITLTASDHGPNVLSYIIVDPPDHGVLGVLEGSEEDWFYAPAANYYGPDQFTFKVNDGEADSNIATVSITVNPVNDKPDFDVVNVSRDEDTNPHSVVVTAIPFNPGAGNESYQQIAACNLDNFVDLNTPPVLAGTPEASPNGDGKGCVIAFETVPNNYSDGANITFDLQIQDSGGTDFGGVDLSDKKEVTITINPVNDPPVISISRVTNGPSGTNEPIQYSDTIGTVTITATDVDDHSLTLDFEYTDNDGLAISSSLPGDLGTTGSCTAQPNDTTASGTSCSWDLTGQMLKDAGDYDITFTVTDYGGGTSVPEVIETDSGETEIIVDPEDVTITFDGDNEVAVQVATEGGNSGEFVLEVEVVEPRDNATFTAYSGDLTLANISMQLTPVGPGSPISPLSTPCSESKVDGATFNDKYLQVTTFSCVFVDVPVDTYSVDVKVDGGYYAGTNDDVLTVFDPSLGFTSGGGWFYWPKTNDKVNFGYTMKYNKKRTNLQGSLLVIRHREGIWPEGEDKWRIKSNALEGLALGEIDGSDPLVGIASFSGKATYKAPGVDNEGNHEFTFYVEDHGEPGVGVDQAWLETRDKADGVVADLSMPMPGSGNTETLEGGNIVVPVGGGGGGKGNGNDG